MTYHVIPWYFIINSPMIDTSEFEWGESSHDIVSFRSCVRAVWLLERIRSRKLRAFPFPLSSPSLPFSLVRKAAFLLPYAIEVNRKWNRSGIGVTSKCSRREIYVQPKWARSEIEMQSKWHRGETEVNSKWWKRSAFDMTSKSNRSWIDVDEIEVNSKRAQSEIRSDTEVESAIEATPAWARIEFKVDSKRHGSSI